MPDREKVIKTLTDALSAKENYPWAKAEMSFEFIEMLLELLKEQEKEIENMREINKKADNTLEIVKDKLNYLLKKTEGR